MLLVRQQHFNSVQIQSSLFEGGEKKRRQQNPEIEIRACCSTCLHVRKFTSKVLRTCWQASWRSVKPFRRATVAGSPPGRDDITTSQHHPWHMTLALCKINIWRLNRLSVSLLHRMWIHFSINTQENPFSNVLIFHEQTNNPSVAERRHTLFDFS